MKLVLVIIIVSYLAGKKSVLLIFSCRKGGTSPSHTLPHPPPSSCDQPPLSCPQSLSAPSLSLPLRCA